MRISDTEIVVRHKLREQEAGLKPARSLKHDDELRHDRWLNSSYEAMMIAGFING